MTTAEPPSNALAVDHKILVRAGRVRVWQALTRDEELAKWFCTRAGLDLREGGRFELEWSHFGPDDYSGMHVATVEAVEAERRLVFRWKSHDSHPETRVEFILEPRGPITVVSVRETGFGDNLDAAMANKGGWAEGLAALKYWVEHGAPY